MRVSVRCRTSSLLLGAIILLALSACEAGTIRRREAGALTGGALGAGLGAIIGNQTGDSGAGIAIGSAIGAISGGILGNSLDNQHAGIDENERRISEQERELAENRRLLEELRRRGADARVTDRGVLVNLPDVLFEFDSARLTGEARSVAREIAEVVSQAGDRHVSVEGHTDSIGTVGYNQRLSEERARSVAAELNANGVPRRQVSTIGHGEGRPIASNHSDAGRERNRRVEVIIENR